MGRPRRDRVQRECSPEVVESDHVSEEVEDLRRRLARAEGQVAALERAHSSHIEQASRTHHQLRTAHEFLRAVYRAMPGAMLVVDETGRVQDANDSLLAMVGAQVFEVVGGEARSLFHGECPDFSTLFTGPLQRASARTERALISRSGRVLPVLFSATPVQIPGERRRALVCVAVDLSERKRMEAELRQAHKLESVGRLAAGVAHEINTPVQFVSDSVHFASEAFEQVVTAITGYRELRATLAAGEDWRAAAARVDELEQTCDLAYAIENVPKALARATGGLSRIADIVRSMRVFAHPARQKAPADLTEAIRATLVVAASEYNLIADLGIDLCELPPVVCHVSDINQAFLNLVVNAGQAMTEVVRQTGKRGKLQVTTRRDRDDVVISIADTGPGIPEAIRDRVFDPFFTTKIVGQGTGQGLAVAHAVVCEMHAGALTFDTECGRGTTFHVRLPIAG
jgi:two-component system, NtrC family, sensor kinase